MEKASSNVSDKRIHKKTESKPSAAPVTQSTHRLSNDSGAAVPSTSKAKPSTGYTTRTSKESKSCEGANKVDGKRNTCLPILSNPASTSKSTLNQEHNEKKQERAELWNKPIREQEKQKSKSVTKKDKIQESAEFGKKLLVCSSEVTTEIQLHVQAKKSDFQRTSSEVSTQTDLTYVFDPTTRRIKGLTCLSLETMNLIELVMLKIGELQKAEERAKSVPQNPCICRKEQTSSNSNLDGKTKQSTSRAVFAKENTALHNNLPVSKPSEESRRSISEDMACQSRAEKSPEEVNEREVMEFQKDDENDECQIIGMVKPLSERPPVIISLCSDDESATEGNEQDDNATENEKEVSGLSVSDELAVPSSKEVQKSVSNNPGRVSCSSSSRYIQHNISPSNTHEPRPGKRKADSLGDCCSSSCSRHCKRRS